MNHWSDAYMNIPWQETNCGELAAKIQAEVFHHPVNLPSEVPPGIRGQSSLIKEMLAEYGDPVTVPVDGDAVLMLCGSKLWHVGAFCMIGGTPHTIHSLRNAGKSVRHAIYRLPVYGLTVEGYYRWK